MHKNRSLERFESRERGGRLSGIKLFSSVYERAKLFSDDWEGSGIGQYLRREISTPVEAFVLGRGQKDIGGSGNFGGG